MFFFCISVIVVPSLAGDVNTSNWTTGRYPAWHFGTHCQKSMWVAKWPWQSSAINSLLVRTPLPHWVGFILIISCTYILVCACIVWRWSVSFCYRDHRPLFVLMLDYCLGRSWRSKNESDVLALSSGHIFSGMICRAQCISRGVCTVVVDKIQIDVLSSPSSFI